MNKQNRNNNKLQIRNSTAENEFEIAGQARNPIQDRIFESDFDRAMKMIENKNE